MSRVLALALSSSPACLLDFDARLLATDDVRTIGTGPLHTCVLVDDGTPWCWGGNVSGQLGRDADGTDAPAPVDGVRLRSIDADGEYAGHTCGIADDDALWCWGTNGDAELGQGSVGGGGPTPVVVPLDAPTRRVALGVTVSLALDDRGRLWTWGWNGGERLGLPAEVGHQSSPRLLDDVRVWTTLGFGTRHGCAIDEDGALWCWGEGDDGKLGRAATDARPAPVEGGASTWRVVAPGAVHTCAIAREGSLWCWGGNAEAQLGHAGDGGPTPRRVGDARDWIAIAAGAGHTCGVREPGSLWCWGDNAEGQLGVGTLNDHDAPRRVGERDDWIEIAAAGQHSCGRTADGATWCWGSNAQGQVGTGEYIAVPSPVLIVEP